MEAIYPPPLQSPAEALNVWEPFARYAFKDLLNPDGSTYEYDRYFVRLWLNLTAAAVGDTIEAVHCVGAPSRGTFAPLHKNDSQQVIGNFNGSIEKARLVLLSEFDKQDLSRLGRLKHQITSDTVSINERVVNSYVNYLLCTNEVTAYTPVSTRNERPRKGEVNTWILVARQRKHPPRDKREDDSDNDSENEDEDEDDGSSDSDSSDSDSSDSDDLDGDSSDSDNSDSNSSDSESSDSDEEVQTKKSPQKKNKARPSVFQDIKLAKKRAKITAKIEAKEIREAEKRGERGLKKEGLRRRGVMIRKQTKHMWFLRVRLG
eukprot:697434-Pleurochrysis_carterae.AAC.3